MDNFVALVKRSVLCFFCSSLEISNPWQVFGVYTSPPSHLDRVVADFAYMCASLLSRCLCVFNPCRKDGDPEVRGPPDNGFRHANPVS